MPIVKKTVAIHPLIDSQIRRAWAVIIEKGHDASYSTALNWLLLAGILGFQNKDLSEKTLRELRSFTSDRETMDDLLLEDALATIGKAMEVKKTKRIKSMEEEVRTVVK